MGVQARRNVDIKLQFCIIKLLVCQVLAHGTPSMPGMA
jgi:hypothetical protein